MNYDLLLKFFATPIEQLLNIRKNTIVALHRLSLFTVRDLLFHKPSSYLVKKIALNPTDLVEGSYLIIRLKIQTVIKKKQFLKVVTSTQLGNLNLIFFHSPPPFFLKQLRPNNVLTIEGKVEHVNNQWQMVHPELIFGKVMPIEPIYPLTYGLVNKQLHKYILQALSLLPESNLLDAHCKIYQVKDIAVPSFAACLHNIHLPQNLGLANYYERLSLDEALANQLAYLAIYQHSGQGRKFPIAHELKAQALEQLGFSLTSGQQHVIQEIEQEQVSDKPMIRLLQGDVGVGKTLVALLTMLNVIHTKTQAALMAPTDLLAKQHYQFFSKILDKLGFKVAVLTGKMSAKAQAATLRALSTGEIDILVGTHALFQEKVVFKDLGYIVIDEQHRFGVLQRLSLVNKGYNLDLLIMTATPIPRSLALATLGNIKTSGLHTKISGRTKIITRVVSSTEIHNLKVLIQEYLARKEQVYWICPLVEPKDNQKGGAILQDIATRFEYLNEVYPGQVGIIHGKMPMQQRDIIMEQFQTGAVSILVATTVIEVGIDVQQASLIIIEEAQQFGLAQLHQLRGRVGRSDKQSKCILVYNKKYLSEVAKQRLLTICRSHDGFEIAKQDLILRGKGEVLGQKQSGTADFFFIDEIKDANLLEDASKLVNQERSLNIPNFQLLIEVFSRRIEQAYKAI